MAAVFFEQEPPQPGPDMPIMRIAGTTQTRYMLLGNALLGVWTHYTKHGTQPCINPRSECTHCQTTRNRRWKGYIHALNMRSKEQGFLEVTPGGAKSIREQHGSLVQLRGVQILGSRGEGKKTRQRIECTFALPSSEKWKLPDEKSPLITLNEMWGLAKLALHVPTDADLDESKQIA